MTPEEILRTTRGATAEDADKIRRLYDMLIEARRERDEQFSGRERAQDRTEDILAMAEKFRAERDALKAELARVKKELRDYLDEVSYT